MRISVRRRLGVSNLTATAGAWVDAAPGPQSIHSGDVRRQVRALVGRLAIPVEAEPYQVFDCSTVSTLLDPWPVEILNSAADAPAPLAGEGPVDQKGTGIAQMQGPSR